MNQFISTFVEEWPSYILEIFVIIIGVLGAYILNKWYEHNKASKKEKKYLLSLLEDLKNQKQEIQTQITCEKPILDSIVWISHMLLTHFKASSPNEVNKHLIRIFEARVFNTYNTTILDMQSSGNLDLISNERLKKNILKFYKDLSRKSNAMQNNIYHEVIIYIQGVLKHGMINIHPDYYSDSLGLSYKFDTEIESYFDQISYNNLMKEENLIHLKNAISGKAMLVKMHLYFLESLNEQATSLIAQFD